MKKSLGVKTLMYPMPVLIIATYGEDGSVDAMNAAWGGIHNTNQIGICLSKEHKTVDNIFSKKAFTVSFADVSHVAACDYVGLVSGHKEKNKLEKAGFTVSKAEKVDAPVINELGLALECSFVSYDEESEYMVADIVNVLAEESVLTNGVIDPKKLQPITYDSANHKYIALGEVVGSAFKDGLSLK
ncbi:MAG: flavin reductase [Treponema sp.]|nr:flavin reductase [Treponema sp.]